MLEKARQERGDDAAFGIRHEAPAFQPHIGAVAEHRKYARVSRRTSDAELFELLDQARFGIAGRRLGEVLVALDVEKLQRLLRHELRQTAVLAIGVVVAALLIELQETVEQRDRSRRPQRRLAIGCYDVDGGAFLLCGFHLARKRTLP